MAFDFPASPYDGQEFTPAGGPSYIWHPPMWTRKVSSGAGGGAATSIGDDPPASPVNGQLWWESDAGNIYIWYDDGNTAQWVQVNIPAYMLEDYLPKIGGTLSGDLSIIKEPSPNLILERAKTGAGNDFGPLLKLQQRNSAGESKIAAYMQSYANSVTPGAENFSAFIGGMRNGTVQPYFYIGMSLPGFAADSVGLVKGQLQFPGTQNPSSDVNTLDDYREVSWVPILQINSASTGITYSTQTGNATKVGSLVSFTGRITLTSKGALTGNVSLGGLPWSSAVVHNLSIGYHFGTTAMTGGPRGYGGGTTVTMVMDGSAGNVATMTNAQITNSLDIMFSGSYQTA